MDYIPDDCCTMHKIIKLSNIVTLFTQSKLKLKYSKFVSKLLAWVSSWSHQNMACSDCTELVTGLYQCVLFDFFKFSMHVYSKLTENTTHLKAFQCIYINVQYILDINWSLNLSINICGFYRTQSNWLPILFSESNWLIFFC